MKKRSTIADALRAANLEQYITKDEQALNQQTPGNSKANRPVKINRQKTAKKIQKEKRSRWDYDVPDLELKHLYSRIEEIMDVDGRNKRKN